MYCVVDESPRPHHCGVRELKKYEAFYGKNESTQEFTNQCNEVLLKKLRGPIISIPLATNANNDGTYSIPLKQFTNPLKQCVPINPVEDVRTDFEIEIDEQEEAEMNEFGFLNIFQQDNDDCGFDDAADDVSFVFDPNEAVPNGYTTIQPAISECSRMITNQGGLAIANKHIGAMKEELYRYATNNTKKKERKHNEFVSLPAIEKKKKYKRLAPHGSPSNRR